MKSYGRAPTFLLATGHEQVRSIAAMLTGDTAAAGRVELELPETGVCSTRPASRADAKAAAGSTCCGGPPPPDTAARCADDAAASAAGKGGRGCAPAPELATADHGS
jgi:hypothetical protein